jgi:hypothetical protein
VNEADDSLPAARSAPEPITDSPWLWFAIFSACGLAALLATGGKFGERQAGIERKYQARAAVASGQLQVEDVGAGQKRAVGMPDYATPEHTAVPIWPLEIILAILCAGSFAMLLRRRLAGRDAGAGP